MPLSPPVERTCLHNRTYDFHGYQRADGLWDIEGRIVDTKSYPFANQDRGEIPPGEALHDMRSEEHTSELQSLMRISYAVFCLHKNQHNTTNTTHHTSTTMQNSKNCIKSHL